MRGEVAYRLHGLPMFVELTVRGFLVGTLPFIIALLPVVHMVIRNSAACRMSFLNVSATISNRSGQSYVDSFGVDVMTAADLSKGCVVLKAIRWHEGVFFVRNVKGTGRW